MARCSFTACCGQVLPVPNSRQKSVSLKSSPPARRVSVVKLRAGQRSLLLQKPIQCLDISRRTGRNSHGAELMKYAQKVESFPSETPTVLVDIAASSRQPQGSSFQSALTVARGAFL